MSLSLQLGTVSSKGEGEWEEGGGEGRVGNHGGNKRDEMRGCSHHGGQKGDYYLIP